MVFTLLASDSVQLEPVHLIVKDVGQGSCAIIKIPNTDYEKDSQDQAKNQRFEYLIVDAGTSAFNASKQVQEVIKKSSAPEKNIIQSSVVKSTKQDENNILQKILDELKFTESKEKSKLLIKSIIITHPDKDHHSLLIGILKSKNVVVKNLILGGSYEKYKNNGIFNTLQEFIDRGLVVHLPHHYLTINNTEEIKLFDRSYNYSLSVNTELKSKNNFQIIENKNFMFALDNALKFNNENFKVELLGINRLYFTENKELKRMTHNLHDDSKIYSDEDSLFVRIKYGKENNGYHSAIISSDATESTTQKLIEHYKDQNSQSLLKTNILIANHHRSSNHESNNMAWLSAINPDIILISHSALYGHPKQSSYENFKKIMLEQTYADHIISFGNKEQETIKYTYPISKRAIFSTMTNGDLKVSIPLPTPERKSELTVKIANTFKDGESTFTIKINNSKQKIRKQEINLIQKADSQQTKAPDPTFDCITSFSSED